MGLKVSNLGPFGRDPLAGLGDARPPTLHLGLGGAGVVRRPAPGCFPGHTNTAIPQARQVHRINKADTLSLGGAQPS